MCEESEKVHILQAIVGTLEFIICCLLLWGAFTIIKLMTLVTTLSLGERLIILLLILYGTLWGINTFFMGLAMPLKFIAQHYKKNDLAFNPPE